MSLPHTRPVIDETMLNMKQIHFYCKTTALLLGSIITQLYAMQNVRRGNGELTCVRSQCAAGGSARYCGERRTAAARGRSNKAARAAAAGRDAESKYSTGRS